MKYGRIILDRIIKSTFILVLLIFGSAFAKQAQDVNEAERIAYIQAHQPFRFLKAFVEDQKVHLNFKKSGRYDQLPRHNPKQYNFDDVFNTIRIYRKNIDLNWDMDRAEVLEGLICTLSPNDIIYEGPIKPKNSAYDYYDTTVKQGGVYAYFVTGAQGTVTGPAAVKIRDPQIWWTKAKIASELYQLKKDYPKLVEVKPAGKSLRGNDILSIKAGSGKKKLAMIGAVHASESGPELIIPFIREVLKNHKPLLKDVCLLSIPCVNIDERNRAASGYVFYLRSNAIGVDLNRNFPGDWNGVSHMYGSTTSDPTGGTYRGPAPASEPETQAVVTFLRANRPDVVLSYHHLASVTGRCFWASAAGKEDESYVKKCRKVYDIYTQGYCTGFPDERPQDDYLTFKAPPGSLPVWCYREFGIPAFELERHAGLDKSFTDETDYELLARNQKQHTAALLNLMKHIDKL